MSNKAREIIGEYYNIRKSRTECYLNSIGNPDKSFYMKEIENLTDQTLKSFFEVIEERIRKLPRPISKLQIHQVLKKIFEQ